MWSEYMAKVKKKSRVAARPGARKVVAKSSSRKAATKAGPARLSDLGDWRDATLSHVRALIMEADPDVVEERKWRKPSNPAGVPVWSHGGIICTGERYQNAVKLTFMYGASLPDPKGLFNTGFGGNTRRAIDIPEGASVDAAAFKALIRAAVAFNTGKNG
jgi:hypothetical protein